MKIAIIGTGIAGLTCAWKLRERHDITVFEANDYIGGHTATVDVEVESGCYAIDTGFIVFNDRTYPNFEDLLREIGIGRQPTEMSFSVQNEAIGLEYNGHDALSMFAQWRNFFSPRYYRFIGEILRFNQLAREASLDEMNHITLGEFLSLHEFSPFFCQNYILPMGAAIWSSTLSDMRAFPFPFFARFFRHHGLLEVTNRPQWFVVPGGSREYVRSLVRDFEDRIHLNQPVRRVERCGPAIAVSTSQGTHLFDQVIFACHSNQALAMLADPTVQESRVLGAIPYQDNEVVLHTDTNLLPNTRRAWAAWNYHLPHAADHEHRLASMTYNMNILQGLSAPETFCVTLNRTQDIDPEKILRRFTYAHPVFNVASIAAQQQRELINGKQGYWFCGAYWYNGFHEDGVRSALDVVREIEILKRDTARDRSEFVS
ncbi:FAD-dependent oxidoreductase [Photobacterium sp. CCB-ST2H9]|uniref:NAD(P)/FAD-dependent oxidoreductase n=1 Tax=Photobacterium sp. CCB-ST2H9 TaxID=2912855 RepID=UPI002006C8A3|nr:FAD-dependent oxidoreductase [Photobacterium sp. CCB-ST2H9]UTM60170.1 FAD-dependent oxidoreductase [Photobacterium sp. CCB-ST2H9]